MSKRDEIVKALKSARWYLETTERSHANAKTTVEALEAALKAEEDLLQYDAYATEQEARAHANGVDEGFKRCANVAETDIF